MAPGLRLGLVVGVDLIDPLLQQRAEELDASLQEEFPKHGLHWDQRSGQILQQGVEHYLEFFGERLV